MAKFALLFCLLIFSAYGSSQIIPSFFNPTRKVQQFEKHVIEKINHIINNANTIFVQPKERAKQLVEEMKKKSEKINKEARNFVNNILKNVSMRCINMIKSFIKYFV
ncbi:uncharacterized protein LOC116185384 [Apis dorsata]|uniref:uncharacterized protein LOC116185384 n=1 Tax=Apis dorsata TaxID=7462 RepID=UPI001293CEBE|nr:uncharacterized protein LOC116185384 [Apis dorsata]